MPDEDYTCKICDGTGMAVPDCPTCEGRGWVEDTELGGTMTCPECNGDKCEACNGTGEEPEEPVVLPVATKSAKSKSPPKCGYCGRMHRWYEGHFSIDR